MFGEIQIILEDATYPPRFRLAEAGIAPRVGGVAVIDAAAEETLWWVVPASFEHVFQIAVEETTEQVIEDLAKAESIDPIEDLPPSDPRHRAALEARDQVNDAAFPLLQEVTYGAVPPGFKQAAPNGTPAVLVPGRQYALAVIGPGGHGGLEFQVQ